ncbi:MAG: pyridoxamine 5'-phosphate oxidase family protein [Spirochaetia bacterium]
MGEIYGSLDTTLREWIAQQKVFFVGTAPLAANGLINCSPKGLDTFRVVSEHEAVYLDLTGSGVETIAHLKENGRIVIMFCSFDAIPRILRLHGTGYVYLPHSAQFDAYRPLFGEFAGVRSIIKMEVKRIADACGYGVPEYTFNVERDTLVRELEHQGAQGVLDYQKSQNARSLDGLPGLRG